PAVPQTLSGTALPRRGAPTPPPDRRRSEWPSLCPSPPFSAIPPAIDRMRSVGTPWRAMVKPLPLVASLPSSPTTRRPRLLRFQPFLDQAMDALVGDSVLDETHRPFVTPVVEGHHDTLPIISTSRNG